MNHQAGGGGDPYFASVTLLLDMGGADGSTTFTDSATSPHTMTSHGNVKIDTALGYNAALFDGSGDYITTPYVQSDFDWWTSDYTLEAWINPSNLSTWSYVDGTSNPTMIGGANPGSKTNYWSFGPISDGHLCMYYYRGSPRRVVSAQTVATSALTHIAMSKTSAGITLAVGGVVDSPVAIVGTPLSSTSGVLLTIGQIDSTSINGRIKAIRITKGVAKYTSNFTPPPAPFPTS